MSTSYSTPRTARLDGLGEKLLAAMARGDQGVYGATQVLDEMAGQIQGTLIGATGINDVRVLIRKRGVTDYAYMLTKAERAEALAAAQAIDKDVSEHNFYYEGYRYECLAEHGDTSAILLVALLHISDTYPICISGIPHLIRSEAELVREVSGLAENTSLAGTLRATAAVLVSQNCRAT